LPARLRGNSVRPNRRGTAWQRHGTNGGCGAR
jgi:hypothetical protein